MTKDVKKERMRVAIGCQGGGIMTAFTAGVLEGILKEKENNYDIVALSGTSGGAICALFAWYGLLTDDRDKAISQLDSFWREGYAATYWDMLLNGPAVWTYRFKDIIPVSEITPNLYPCWPQDFLHTLLNTYVNFEELETLIKHSSPKLYIGSVNVRSGGFKVFKSHSKSYFTKIVQNEISNDAILASLAMPTLSRPWRIHNMICWDGLFSQNPPLKEFVVTDSETKPDEIWIIQINRSRREEWPTSIKEIECRRNELAGNLSLNQEIFFLEVINSMLEAGSLQIGRLKPIKIRKIEMLLDLDPESMLDISQPFIDDLMTYGRSQAKIFLEKLATKEN